MRVIVLSDVHANLAALEAVLRHAEDGGGIDAVWCLGDSVGYGPQPGECVRRLEELDATWVAGNHERAATGAIGVEDFNAVAATAALWTKDRLSDADAAYLDALPEVHTADGCTLVHGTLRWPIWEYLLSEETALAHLELQETRLSFVGHTHVPMAARLEDGESSCRLYGLSDGKVVRIADGGKTVVNPGSVGQPRDEDPRASYAVYDTNESTVALHRVEYDIATTQRLMREAELPEWLIERLEVGR